MISLEALRAERDKLEKEVSELEPKQRQLALIVELLRCYEPVAQDEKPFAGLSVSAAILRYLERCPGNVATRSEIGAALLAGGISSDADDFPAGVGVELSRLCQRGRVHRVVKEGKVGYVKTRPAPVRSRPESE